MRKIFLKKNQIEHYFKYIILFCLYGLATSSFADNESTIELFEKNKIVEKEFKQIKSDLNYNEYIDLIIKSRKDDKLSKEMLANYCFKIRKENNKSIKSCMSGKLTPNISDLIKLNE